MTTILRLVACACLALAASAHAAWPDERAIRLVVPTPAGGSADVIARTVAAELSTRLQQSIVIDNKPGAAGNIGAALVAKAPADGYTLLMHAVALTVNPWLYKDPGYDIARSFEPVALMGIAPNVLFVPPDSPVKSLPDLVAQARKDKLSYASSGNGTTTHLGAEMLFNAAGIEILHVPHAPATGLTAVAGGHVSLGSAAAPAVVPLAASHKVRPIAVTSLQRSRVLPDVPTVAESGYPGFEATTWFALFAPAGTPPAILERLHAEIASAIAVERVATTFEHQSIEVPAMSRADLQSFVRSETTKWGVIVKKLGLKAD